MGGLVFRSKAPTLGDHEGISEGSRRKLRF